MTTGSIECGTTTCCPVQGLFGPEKTSSGRLYFHRQAFPADIGRKYNGDKNKLAAFWFSSLWITFCSFYYLLEPFFLPEMKMLPLMQRL